MIKLLDYWSLKKCPHYSKHTDLNFVRLKINSMCINRNCRSHSSSSRKLLPVWQSKRFFYIYCDSCHLSRLFRIEGKYEVQLLVSKKSVHYLNVVFIRMRQFHSLIFLSVLDFHLEISYSFLIFVFSSLKKSYPYLTHQKNNQKSIFGGRTGLIKCGYKSENHWNVSY